jgi:membrane protein YqaA with SNARE-associated domain
MPKKTSMKDGTNPLLREYGGLLRFFGAIVLITIILILLQPVLLKMIAANPDLNETYQFVVGQIHRTSILWLFIIAFIGGLFFIAIPVDIIFSYYLIMGADPLLCIIAAFVGVMLSRCLDFWFGHLFDDYVREKILREDVESFNARFSRWESSIVFFGNFIPLFPLEPFIVFLGTTDYKFTKFLLYHGMGKLLKLVLIAAFILLIGHHTNLFDFIVDW